MAVGREDDANAVDDFAAGETDDLLLATIRVPLRCEKKGSVDAASEPDNRSGWAGFDAAPPSSERLTVEQLGVAATFVKTLGPNLVDAQIVEILLIWEK